MELKDFIQKTLTEICDAVTEAGKSNQQIAPQIFTEWISDKQTKPSLIEFDIAVTTTEENSKEGGAKVGTIISVLKADIGGKKTDRDETSSATRIKFSVPVYFNITRTKEN